MEQIIVYIKACIILVFLSFSSQTVAQIEKSDIKLLQGVWELEETNANYVNDTSHIDVKDIDIEIYSEINFHDKSVTTTSIQGIKTGEYKINKAYLEFSFSNIPFDSYWNVFDNKLYLLQKIKKPADETDTMHISYIYKRK